MSTRTRVRLLGGVTGASVGVPAGLLVNSLVEPTVMPLAIPAALTGAIVGMWLAPSLISADGVKTAAVGLGAGLVALPVAGFLGGIVLATQQMLDGNGAGFAAPFALALYLPVFFPGLFIPSVLAALTWAVVARRFAISLPL